MLLRRAFLSALLALAVTQALAAEGFVIESNGANMAVGAAVENGSAISIPAGGHLVILTSSGQMLRRNGPFEGTGEEALGAAGSGAKGGGAKASALDALVDLALEKGTATDRVFATRSSNRNTNAGPFSITPETRTYCHRSDVAPAFVLSPPPAQDLPLMLDRTSRPKSSQNAYWPAGQPRIVWPQDWPPLEQGSYEWSAGFAQGAFSVKVISAKAVPSDLLAVAAELKRQGCGDQAWIALQDAIMRAPVIE